MNCPQCGKEMAFGWIHGCAQLRPMRRMLWSPNQDKRTPVKGKEDVLLIQSGPPPAFICKDCRQVVLSYLDASPYDSFRE